jgi:predicted Zn-dependent protease with MMP-like domain
MTMERRLWNRLLGLAQNVVDATVRGLPDALRGPAGELPILLEGRPSREIADEMGADDLLGLFVGLPHGEMDALDPMPPRVVLYLENLWNYAEGQEDVFLEEVRLTVLHELGHYLGLDEEEVEERGL